MVDKTKSKNLKVFISTSSFGQGDARPLELLKNAGLDIQLNPFGRTLKPDECLNLYRDIDGLIAGTEAITGEILRSAKSLKVISRCGVGADNIDMEVAERLGIKVFTTPDVLTAAVAELTLGLVLDCLRKISLSDRLMRKGVWEKTMGNLLKGKVFGIIGFGRIGKAVGRLARAFGAEVIYYDVVQATDFPEARRAELEELLRSANIISLHLPLVKGNDYFINVGRISLMKEGAILINTARGALVDENALYNALKSGKLSAAGIDVFEKEPYSGRLTELDNVVLTCHMGSYAVESRIMMEREAVENLLRGLNE